MLKRVNSRVEQKFETQLPQQIEITRENMYGGVEESEVVEELVQILVECVKKVDVKGQEFLLRKFFYEIEKEIPLQSFLVDRLKRSKISYLFENLPACSGDSRSETEFRTREIKEETPEKLDRFKIKTVQIGVVVKEENANASWSLLPSLIIINSFIIWLFMRFFKLR